ncbi:iron chelate uptake ABC transporter family permease subunit, partial [Bacillus sp. D-CC]
IKITIPFGIIGILLALLISKSITILSLGEEVSINLGQRTKLVKVMAILSVIFLTGTAVALVGKVGFVGLIIPHITRFIIGVDYKWILPCAGVIGGVFLVIFNVTYTKLLIYAACIAIAYPILLVPYGSMTY